MVFHKGDVVKNNYSEGTVYSYHAAGTDCAFGHTGKREHVHYDKSGGFDYVSVLTLIKAAPCTLETLEVGDEVATGTNGTKTVLAVSGKLFALSNVDMPGHLDDWWTVQEMEEKGFTVKLAEPEDDTVEMTLEEVAELKGVPVEKLRIKEGK